MADAARALARPDAAEEVARELLRRRPDEVAERRRGGAGMSATERPWAGRRMHLVGVGGAGMSGYARAAHALGAEVSGSDARAQPLPASASPPTACSRPRSGTRAENLPSGDGVELVLLLAPCRRRTSSASAARERGIPELTRAELLGELTALRRTIAVAGTHGKTTTASMIVHALRGAGIEPGWLIGGADRRRPGERRVGRGRVAGRRGRRVRPLDAQPERGDRAC